MDVTWAGRRVLLVEDNAIVALPLVAHFEDCGAVVIGPVPSLDRALAALDDHGQIDGAVLDVELGSEKVWPLATRLAKLGIPFVFATGSAEDCFYPPDLLSYPRFVKPYAEDAVAKALRDLIENAPARETGLTPRSRSVGRVSFI